MQGWWTGWFSLDIIFCLVLLVCGLTCTLGPILLPLYQSPVSPSVPRMQPYTLPVLNESATWTGMVGPLHDAQWQPWVDSQSTLGNPVAVATVAEVSEADEGQGVTTDLHVDTAFSAQQQAAALRVSSPPCSEPTVQL